MMMEQKTQRQMKSKRVNDKDWLDKPGQLTLTQADKH